MKDFHKIIVVKASPKEVMKRISQVDQWWAKKVTGKTENLKDKFTVHFGATFVDFEISELVTDKKVAWKVTDCNLHWVKAKKEWKGTVVVFELTKKKDSTQIDFTHIGLVPGVECYEDCEVGWSEHLKVGLESLINTGKGKPE